MTDENWLTTKEWCPSPDGEKMAYQRFDGSFLILDLKDAKSKVIGNYSGEFNWAPDSKSYLILLCDEKPKIDWIKHDGSIIQFDFKEPIIQHLLWLPNSDGILVFCRDELSFPGKSFGYRVFLIDNNGKKAELTIQGIDVDKWVPMHASWGS